MKTLSGPLAAVVLLILAAAGVAIASDELTWTHSGARVFVHGEGDEVFDVAELADGETRVFGGGERRLTARREGDVVRIEGEPGSSGRPMDVVCDLDETSCSILTSEDGDSVALVMNRGGCADGRCESANHVVRLAGADHHANVMIHRTERCEGDDCGTFEVLLGAEEGAVLGEEGNAFRFLTGDGVLIEHGKTTLRCPEGDTTTRVADEDRDGTYLCPQHSVPLVPVEKPKLRRIRIHRDGDGDGRGATERM